jgi:hypothetical protein
MTHTELIAEARKYAADIANLSKDPAVTLEKMPQAALADAVVVSFTGEDPERKMFVVLEKASGQFVASGWELRQRCDEH